MSLIPYYQSEDRRFNLFQGDSMDLLPRFKHRFDMVFADPPYFLSNDGLSIQNGQIVSVNKGEWDKAISAEHVHRFNMQWLSLLRPCLKENGTVWISGTMHNIFSVGMALGELGYKILNMVTWEKTNPPPNFSCRYLTFSTEQILWARKSPKVPHYYNYDLMRRLNDQKQMKDVWRLPAIAPWEKSCGKHPTQKPLSVLTRLILASTQADAWILDPFAGSSTTGIAANLANRRYVGLDLETVYLDMGIQRRQEIEDPAIAAAYRAKISGFEPHVPLNSYLQEEVGVAYEKPPMMVDF
jgi:site-specific DNA-methyltransferase (adenine-specific)